MNSEKVLDSTTIESLYRDYVENKKHQSDGFAIKHTKNLIELIDKIILKERRTEKRCGRHKILSIIANELYIIVVMFDSSSSYKSNKNIDRALFVTNDVEKFVNLKSQIEQLLTMQTKIFHKYQNKTNQELLHSWCIGVDKNVKSFLLSNDLLNQVNFDNFCTKINLLIQTRHQQKYKQIFSAFEEENSASYEIIKSGKIIAMPLYARYFKLVKINEKYIFFLSPLIKNSELWSIKFYKQIEFDDCTFLENFEDKLKSIFLKLRCDFCENFSSYTFGIYGKGCQRCYHNDLDKLQCNGKLGSNTSEMIMNVFLDKRTEFSTENSISIESM